MKKTIETNLKKNQLNLINRSIKKKYNKINKSLRKVANRVSPLILESSLDQPRGSGDENPRKNLQRLYTFRHIPNEEYKNLKDTLTRLLDLEKTLSDKIKNFEMTEKDMISKIDDYFNKKT
ncbi:unnamed protein product [Brachionus calyciflorus]|uniref:Uncharacterized protein n=1 Tax=Brachionus calyciflorus TaxID=104777 RepID=A0A813RCC3_9BILA|nr:unnamed protein product [Brachionus calyciflorus]